MERLYNPDLMPEDEIKKTFVAREGLVDELMSLVERQPDGAGVQHVVIIAPRGMGKTTVLLMVQFAIRDRGLAKHWQVVRFPEERYNIYDLADFWVEVLQHLDAETGDAELQKRIDDLKKQYPNNDDLQEAALALIKDWRREHKKRLVVLVDNFDMILEQINDERDNARLRDVLMNDGTMMLIGSATTFFHEARAYDQPLYNFFKIYDLPNLRFEQMQDLLRRRAAIDRQPNFEETLKANASRLRVLEHFTGGNPRLVLMLYRVVTQSDISEVRLGLEKLLDEVTPYYKSKVESLPPQQRKILDHIARVSSQTNEGLTPTEIASATRMTPNQASAQLKRLSESGYVQAANLRGRSSYYTLSERLYAIWHQMRFGRDARERMGWLIGILKALYDVEEMREQSEVLESRFSKYLNAGSLHEARDVLEHHRYLVEAMGDAPARLRGIEGIIRGYLDLKDTGTLKKELLTTVNLSDLSLETLAALRKAGCISQEEIVQTIAGLPEIINLATEAVKAGNVNDTLKLLDDALKVKEIDGLWFARGAALGLLSKHEEAVESFDRGIELNRNNAGAWYYRGLSLMKLKRNEDAIGSFDNALRINAGMQEAWTQRGLVLGVTGRCEEAIDSFDRAIKLKPDDAAAWLGRGAALAILNKKDEALISLERGLEIEPDVANYWLMQGHALVQFNEHVKAIESLNRALQIEPDNEQALILRSAIHLKRFVEQVSLGELDSAKKDWLQALNPPYLNRKDSSDVLSRHLLLAAQQTDPAFTRQLIKESNLEEQLFPLARALDYIIKGDESLLEKLSPEVRGIVDELVAKLSKVTETGQPKNKSRAGKSKSGSQRRTKRQLR